MNRNVLNAIWTQVRELHSRNTKLLMSPYLLHELRGELGCTNKTFCMVDYNDFVTIFGIPIVPVIDMGMDEFLLWVDEGTPRVFYLEPRDEEVKTCCNAEMRHDHHIFSDDDDDAWRWKL